jgi:hypothetical protein
MECLALSTVVLFRNLLTPAPIGRGFEKMSVFNFDAALSAALSIALSFALSFALSVALFATLFRNKPPAGYSAFYFAADFVF